MCDLVLGIKTSYLLAGKVRLVVENDGVGARIGTLYFAKETRQFVIR